MSTSTTTTAVHPKRRRVADAPAHFAESTSKHEVTVLHQDGIYRHIRFGAPGTGIESCHITTWPGHLAVTGDMGTFVFAREHDMFPWFAGGISPDYRAQKCVAHDGITRYSPDVLAYELREHLTGWENELREKYGTDDDLDGDAEGDAEEDAAEAPQSRVMTKRGPRPMTTVVSELLNGDAATLSAPATRRGTTNTSDGSVLEGVIAELRAEVEDLIEWRAGSAEEATQALDDFAVTLTLPDGDEKTFEIHDTWEWDLTEWTAQYLWCLHAVHHVVTTLNARKGETEDSSGRASTDEASTAA